MAKVMTSHERFKRMYEHRQADHSVPSSVSLENFRQITWLAKELGKY